MSENLKEKLFGMRIFLNKFEERKQKMDLYTKEDNENYSFNCLEF